MVRPGGKLAVILAPLLILGCASQVVPPPQVFLDAHSCVATPDRMSATPLSFDPANSTDLSVVFDNSAPCLEDHAGQKSLYRIFRLPTAAAPYLVTIASVEWDCTFFAPRVILLGADGGIKRTLGRDDFVFRGNELSTIFRSHADEAFLVVASDPEVVGLSLSRIADSITSQGVSAGRGFFAIYRGSESVSTETFLHSGRVIISTRPVPAD